MLQKITKVSLFFCLWFCTLGNQIIACTVSPSELESALPKTALVTGANKGIGFELTRQMLERGNTVYAVARHTEPLDELKGTYSDQLHIIRADLGTLDGQKSVAPAIADALDYVVHNAAIMHPVGDRAFWEAPEDDLATIMQVNAMAPMIITRGLVGKIKKTTRHLFVSSRAGDTVYPGVGPYCVTKHTMDAYVEALRKDNPGFLAATIHPGEVDTQIQEVLRAPSESTFALAPVFVKTHEDRNLLSPEIAARFFKWVLCGATDVVFVSRKHNIYTDTATYTHWVPEGVEIVNPYPDPSESKD
jgi:benzil reductase ((S)-benzoin forming)